MTLTRHKMTVAVCALALLAVVVLFFRGCKTSVTADNGIGDADIGGSGRTVLIAGDVVQPVSPGVMVPLDLEFINPHDVDLSITALTVVVHDVTAPYSDEFHTCGLDNFAVDQAPADLTITVAARATNTLSGLGLPSTTWPRMGMHDLPVNQDGCKGASLTLDYTAAGTPGDR
jgi:hypothetical protein